MRSETFATGLEPFIAPETFHKVRNLTIAETMKTPSGRISSRKDRVIAAASFFAILLTCGLCHATYAQQASPDQIPKPPPSTDKAQPPVAKPAGAPKSGVLKPPDVDPKMAKKVPDVDPGMTKPPPDKQSPPADKQAPPSDQPPPKVQPK